MHDLERAAVVSAGASADCNIASEGIESYVKLVVQLTAISASPWHRLPLIRYGRKPSVIQGLATLPRTIQPQIDS
jgi:hypothetical protein